MYGTRSPINQGRESKRKAECGRGRIARPTRNREQEERDSGLQSWKRHKDCRVRKFKLSKYSNVHLSYSLMFLLQMPIVSGRMPWLSGKIKYSLCCFDPMKLLLLASLLECLRDTKSEGAPFFLRKKQPSIRHFNKCQENRT